MRQETKTERWCQLCLYLAANGLASLVEDTIAIQPASTLRTSESAVLLDESIDPFERDALSGACRQEVPHSRAGASREFSVLMGELEETC